MLSRRGSFSIADDVLDDAGCCSNAVIASEYLSDLMASRRSSWAASNQRIGLLPGSWIARGSHYTVSDVRVCFVEGM